MPLRRVVPLAVFVFSVVFLFSASARPARDGRGQEPEDKLPAPVAKKVTLPEKGMPLSAALRSFSDQTRIPVRASLENDPILKLDMKGVPFWEALDRIAEAAGARVRIHGERGTIALVGDVRFDKTLPQYVSHSGIFRVALQRLSATLDFENGTAGYKALLEVAWEPDFLPYFLETRPESLVMHDAANAPVRLLAPGGTWEPVEGRKSFNVDLALPALPRAAGKISLLKGAFAIRGATRLVTFEFDTLDKLRADEKKRKKTVDGVTVSVGDIKLGDRAWTIQVTTQLPPASADFDSHQSWDTGNQIYLLNRDGRTRLTTRLYTRESPGSRKAVVSYHFVDTPQVKRGDSADWRLVYRAPAGIVEVPVPFEFKNVRLP
jgi:hypothetical protein